MIAASDLKVILNFLTKRRDYIHIIHSLLIQDGTLGEFLQSYDILPQHVDITYGPKTSMDFDCLPANISNLSRIKTLFLHNVQQFHLANIFKVLDERSLSLEKFAVSGQLNFEDIGKLLSKFGPSCVIRLCIETNINMPHFQLDFQTKSLTLKTRFTPRGIFQYCPNLEKLEIAPVDDSLIKELKKHCPKHKLYIFPNNRPNSVPGPATYRW